MEPTTLLAYEQEDPEADALVKLLRAQQQQQAVERADLEAGLAQQRRRASGMRGAELLTSLGQNSLLQGVQRVAGDQAQAAESEMARAQQRLAALGRGDTDPASALLRLRGLEQGDRRIELAESEAVRKAKAAATGAASRAETLATKDERFGIKLEGDLRKEFQALPAYKHYQTASVAFEQMKSAAMDDSGAGDISLVTNYMRSLDPETGVKDQEFNNAKNSGGFDSKAEAAYNRIMNGQFLTPAMRQDFLKSAAGNVAAHKRVHDAALTRYQKLGTSYKVDPSRVASPASDIDLTVEPPRKSASVPIPLPSATDGKVRGGDPRNVKSTVTFTDPKDGKQKTLRTYANGRITITED